MAAAVPEDHAPVEDPATPEDHATSEDPAGPPHRRRPWAVAAVAAVALAGSLLGVSARTAGGTELRPEVRELAPLIRADQAALADLRARTRRLQLATSRAAALPDAGQAIAPRDGLALAAGTTPVHGPGVEVVLDDAPHRRSLPAGVVPDDVVVHQQDVQAAVDALWAGGAEAMQLMDQRVLATSAVRCVGNTLLLQGVVYSPPYRVRAIGDPRALRAALDAQPGVRLFRQYAAVLGLGYAVRDLPDLRLPGVGGPLPALPRGTVVGAPA